LQECHLPPRVSSVGEELSKGVQEEIRQQVQELVFRDHEGVGKDRFRSGNDNNNGGSNVILRLHGGFIPRPYASRWNKAESMDKKRELLEELYGKDLLPPPPSPMHDGLWSDRDNLLFKGSKPHFRLIKSMMSGEDLYDADAIPSEEEEIEIGTTTPIERLYQAQLLKDHAAAYRLSKLMMENHRDDKFVVLAGIGHLKHRLGIPQCLDLYPRRHQGVPFSSPSHRTVNGTQPYSSHAWP
jgi:hypothetical protein